MGADHISILENAIGIRAASLKTAWLNSAPPHALDRHRAGFETANDWYEKLDHEVFFYDAGDEPERQGKPQKIYMLVWHPPGFYTGMWIDPNNPFDMAMFAQDYDAALEIAEDELALNPDDPCAIFRKAYALSYHDGNDQEVIDLYDRVLSMEPDDTAAMNNKAIALSRLGREDEALALQERTVELDPTDAGYNIALAFAYARNGDMESHFKQLERVMRLAPATIEDKLALYNFKQHGPYQTVEDVHRQRAAYYAGLAGESPDEPVIH